jgi:hypothetical protein
MIAPMYRTDTSKHCSGPAGKGCETSHSVTAGCAVSALARTLVPMRTQRQIVDYSLQKRAVLRELYSGRVGTYEACDASPYLLTAAKFHGEQTELRCPVCRRENLWHVHYIYGDELKQSAGQARKRTELATLAMTYREFNVYVVEVCRGCGWNHLAQQFLLGRAGQTDSPDPQSRREAAK